jgi:hypothetical protein
MDDANNENDVKAVKVHDEVHDEVIQVKVKTNIGRPYSVERYYMLSEIEQHAIRPIYLNDYDNNDNNNNDNDNNSGDDNDNGDLPPYIILYLLWDYCNCNATTTTTSESASQSASAPAPQSQSQHPLLSTAESYCDIIVRNAIDKLEKLLLVTAATSTAATSTPNVYIVIDMLIPSWSPEEKEVAAETLGTDTNNNPEQWYITIAEELARNTLLLVVNNNERQERQKKQKKQAVIKISGVTVGIVNHSRAAPGLESCLDAIMIGSKDRRRRLLHMNDGSSGSGSGSSSSGSSSNSNGINDNLKTNNANTNNKSCIGIVCNCLEDLIGFDEEGETDAVQNVFQSRSVATMMIKPQTESHDEHDEPIIEFAKCAHRYWRVHIAGLSADEPTTVEEEIENKRNDPNTAINNNNNNNNNKYDDIDDNKLVTLMVWITVLVIGYISYYIGNKT